MNYSRHQLYALGEPIGESATRKVGERIVYGSGGGGGSTSSTVTQSNIPDWLRPQVETTLGGSMQEMFNTSPGKDGKLNITGVKGFVPFSQNPSDYVAGFSPMQTQSFGNAANLQVPGQFGMGSQMAQQSGQGALSVAPQAAGIASQQAGAGNQYMGMASDPGSMRAFMSPYMQNVVNVQQQQAQRQADIANQAMNAGFAQRGALGGGGQRIAQSQANAELMRQKQGIQATGLQNAFQNAQQAQQFGSNLGLQGMQGAQQGMQNVLGAYDLLGRQGANVGNLGTQQLDAQRNIINLQNQMGGQQQAQQQSIVNQAIQNFANARQYPLQQYNAYNALLRGYAVPGQTTTSYQAAPSMASTLAGAGTAAYGASQLMGSGRAKGGAIKSMAAGGAVQGMATGGLPALNRKVLLAPESVTLDQIQQGVRNETVSDLIGIPAALQKQQMSQQAAAMQQQQPQQTIAEEALSPVGIPGLQSNLPEQMATGGIVAFSAGDQVKAQPTLADEMTALKAAKTAYGITGDQTPELQAYLKAQTAAASSPEDREQQKAMRIIQAGLGMMGGKSPFAFQNISEGVQPALAGYAEDIKAQKSSGLASLKAQADVAEARRSENLGDIKTASDIYQKRLDRENKGAALLGAQYADAYLKTKLAAGDTRSEPEIRLEGLNKYFENNQLAQQRLAMQGLGISTAANTAQSARELQLMLERMRREEVLNKEVQDAYEQASTAFGKLGMSDNVKMAYAFEKDPAKKQQIMEEWTEKFARNILRARDAKRPQAPGKGPAQSIEGLPAGATTGKQTDKGLEVFDSTGKLIGYGK